MCGIFGFVGRARGMERETLDCCRDALSHRGPDAGASWISDDTCVALAHRRLSIVELSPAGAQPMHWPQPKLSIVFNGEIYNHSEIRDELRREGYLFRGHSDTEVILAGYSKWGEDVFQRLRGMFAIGIYDHALRKLVLARDRAGEKPLYWAKHRGGIVFASELTAILADPEFPRYLNTNAVNSYLALGYVPGEQSLIAGVSKLAPAHIMQFDMQTECITHRRYWNVPAPVVEQKVTEDELVDELHNLLASSVSEQLHADVPVAILLSGGIDSSLITACAAAATSGQVRTFSVGFPGEEHFDERVHARRIASHFGTTHVELDLDPSSVDIISELSERYDEPIADSSMIPTFLLSRLVAQQGKAVLGGDGGDELFGGYRSYQGALKLEVARSVLPRWIRKVVAFSSGALLPVGYPARNALASLGGTISDGVASVGIMFDRKSRLRLVPSLSNNIETNGPERWKHSLVDESRGIPGAYMASDFESYLPNDILVKVDRASMANSLEVRAPFLDHRIVEFAFKKIPNNLRVTRTERKIIPRRLAERLLPPDFDIARKQGFSIPISRWLTQDMRNEMCDEFESQFAEYFDFREVRRLISTKHVGGVTRVFSLLMLMKWMQSRNVQIS